LIEGERKPDKRRRQLRLGGGYLYRIKLIIILLKVNLLTNFTRFKEKIFLLFLKFLVYRYFHPSRLLEKRGLGEGARPS